MDREQAKKRIEKLKKLIDHYRYMYHVMDKSVVSDAVNDSLKHELQELENQFPDLVTPDSPTQRIGGEPLDEFEKVKHATPMLSLVDAFDEGELKDWEERLQKLAPGQKLDYYTELKMDGLAVSLTYRDGVFVQGSTRGDGQTGEDVTQNLKTVEAIPLKLKTQNSKLKTLEVRGEVFMNKKDFEVLNEKQRQKGGQIYANPRNVAAGSVRQLNPKITTSRKLDCYIYSVVTDCGLATHEEEHQLAKELGLKVNPNNRYCKNLAEVKEFIKEWDKKRQHLPYETDGVVVVLNNRQFYGKLGVVGKAPRYMLAYKFPAEQATSVVEDIIVQVGRTGALTPVAILKPTKVAGSTISRATLHNEDEIKRKDIRVGDTVILQKAGDVIPEVVAPLKKLRTGREKEFQMPQKCPICASPVVRSKGEAIHRCANKNCYALTWQGLFHFASKAAFDMEGLGPKILEQFLEKGLIKNAVDLFKLAPGDIEPLERFAEKSSQNIYNSIQAHKKISLERFIYALGVRHVGAEMALDLAAQFHTLEHFRKVKKEQLDRLYGVGEKVAESIDGWLGQEKNQKYIDELLEAGVEIETFHSPVKADKLKGQSFVVTGSLPTITREEAHKKISQFGGDVHSSVSSKTNYLILGENPGSKLDNAKKYHTKIISEKEFLGMIQ